MNKRLLLLTIGLGFASLHFSPLQAGLFDSNDLDQCKDEKVALAYKQKYCYRDKVRAENELSKTQKEFQNVKANLSSGVQTLGAELKKLQERYSQLNKEKKAQEADLNKQIASLEKTIDILKSKSGKRQKKLIQESQKLRDQVKKLQEKLTQEQRAKLLEKEELTKIYDADTKKLKSEIQNLTQEINKLKNLSKDQENELERMINQEAELQKQLIKEITQGEITLKKFHNKLIINIDNKITFDPGSDKLKRGILPIFDKIVTILANYPENQIRIEGHTDNDPVKGRRFKDNWELSTERALSVLRYMLKSKQITPERAMAAGLGEFQPLVPNDSKKNKALNRRVDIVVIPRI